MLDDGMISVGFGEHFADMHSWSVMMSNRKGEFSDLVRHSY